MADAHDLRSLSGAVSLFGDQLGRFKFEFGAKEGLCFSVIFHLSMRA